MIIQISNEMEELIKTIIKSKGNDNIEHFIFESITKNINDIMKNNSIQLLDHQMNNLEDDVIYDFFTLDNNEKEGLKLLCEEHYLDDQINDHWSITLQRFFPIKATIRILMKNLYYRSEIGSFLDARELWNSFNKGIDYSDYWHSSKSPPHLIKLLYQKLLNNNEDNKIKSIPGFWNVNRSGIKDYWRRIGGSLHHAEIFKQKSHQLNNPVQIPIKGHLGELELVFIEINNNFDFNIKLSKEGFEFGLLSNPILDNKDFNHRDNSFLSDREKIWLINHMANHPYEREIIETILEILEKNDFVDFKEIVDHYHETNLKNSYGKNRSICMSSLIRLTEVDLVKKEKRGIYKQGRNSFPYDY